MKPTKNHPCPIYNSFLCCRVRMAYEIDNIKKAILEHIKDNRILKWLFKLLVK